MRGAGKKQEIIAVEDLVDRLVREIQTRALAPEAMSVEQSAAD